MAEAYFSTLISVTAKADLLRIQSGVIDYTGLDVARADSKSEILGYVQQRFGSAVTDLWDTDTRPDLIGTISDWLTLYAMLTGNNAEHPVALRHQEESLAKLEKIAAYTMVIPGIIQTGQTNETTRMQYLDCTQAEADAGECDPCSYEYI